MQPLTCRQYHDYEGTLASHPSMQPSGLVISVTSSGTKSSESTSPENMILQYEPTIPDYVRVDMRKEFGSKLADAVFEKALDFTEVGRTCKWTDDGRQLYAFYFEGTWRN